MNSFSYCDQGCVDGAHGGGIPAFNILRYARKLVKSHPYCKRIGQNTPPPQWKVSWHITECDDDQEKGWSLSEH